jgi:hypothetical protein
VNQRGTGWNMFSSPRKMKAAQRELFETIVDEENLRFDREGRSRTAYSLRRTYICLRLMEGADITQIAKNCRHQRRDDRKVLRGTYQDAV